MSIQTLTAKLRRSQAKKSQTITDRITKHNPIEVGVKVEGRMADGTVTWGEVRSIDRSSPNARVYGATAKLSNGKRVLLISCQTI